MRPEVNVKGQSDSKWYAPLRHPKRNHHSKYAPDTIILKTRSKVKVTLTHKWYTTLHHPKMHPHTKLGTIISNKRYAPDTIIIKTRSKVMVSDPEMLCDTPPSQDASTHQIWNSYLKECKRYAPDTIILKTRSDVMVTVTRK